MRLTSDRRGFLLSAIYGLWGVIGAALAVPAGIYLLWPPRVKKQGEWVEIGDASRLQPGDPDEVVFRRNRVDGWKVSSEKATAWVVKQSSGDLIAFSPQCTHLGCAYHWDEAKRNFICPCHTSAFAMDGKVLSGPAPRPLDRYQVRIENGRILLGPLEKRA